MEQQDCIKKPSGRPRLHPEMYRNLPHGAKRTLTCHVCRKVFDRYLSVIRCSHHKKGNPYFCSKQCMGKWLGEKFGRAALKARNAALALAKAVSKFGSNMLGGKIQMLGNRKPLQNLSPLAPIYIHSATTCGRIWVSEWEKWVYLDEEGLPIRDINDPPLPVKYRPADW